jgi:hypothetical protein
MNTTVTLRAGESINLTTGKITSPLPVDQVIPGHHEGLAANDLISLESALSILAIRAGARPVIAANAEPCNCEHEDHFMPIATGHRHMAVPAGERRADWVGAICDTCADGHMAAYLI